MIRTIQAIIEDLQDAGIKFRVDQERLIIESDLQQLHEIANNSIADFLLEHESLALEALSQKSPSEPRS